MNYKNILVFDFETTGFNAGGGDSIIEIGAVKIKNGEIIEKYDELKNYMLAYGIKSRLSSSGDSFRAKRVMYFKITNSGNSGFKVYFKLDLDAYANTTYPLKDAQGIKMYEEVPAFMYLKSDLSLKRCKELVDDVMAAYGFKKK